VKVGFRAEHSFDESANTEACEKHSPFTTAKADGVTVDNVELTLLRKNANWDSSSYLLISYILSAGHRTEVPPFAALTERESTTRLSE